MKDKLQTPSQTIGPFFAYSLTPEQYCYDFDSWVDGNMIDNITEENTITIVGNVYDGNGDPIKDALIEIWQNDKNGNRFGRYGTGTDKEFRFFIKTIKPQPIGENAPFLSVILFMRGALIHLYTRIYFSDEIKLNSTDDVLQSVPEARRPTLMAKKKGDTYKFNIYMQGEKETVFFDV